MENSMFEEVKKMLVDQLSLNPDDITPEADLTNDLGVNSLEMSDLILFCEEKYGLVIPEEDIRNFATVGDIANYLGSKVNH